MACLSPFKRLTYGVINFAEHTYPTTLSPTKISVAKPFMYQPLPAFTIHKLENGTKFTKTVLCFSIIGDMNNSGLVIALL